MKEIIHEGTLGVFFTKTEFEHIQQKILKNNELIDSLIEGVGLNE